MRSRPVLGRVEPPGRIGRHHPRRRSVHAAGSRRRHPEESVSVPKLVYDFTEGNKDLKDLLGGKGANLAEMTNIGLPVPPGFIITTEACRYYLEQGSTPAGLDEEIATQIGRAHV